MTRTSFFFGNSRIDEQFPEITEGEAVGEEQQFNEAVLLSPLSTALEQLNPALAPETVRAVSPGYWLVLFAVRESPGLLDTLVWIN